MTWLFNSDSRFLWVSQRRLELRSSEPSLGLQDPLPKWLTPWLAKWCLVLAQPQFSASILMIGGQLVPKDKIHETKAETEMLSWPGLRRHTLSPLI